MADNYLEKRQQELAERRPKVVRPHPSLDSLLKKNRSYRGYDSSRVVSREDLLRLLDHGYRFESVSRYISGHPKLFPNLMKNRLKMLSALEDDDDDDDDIDLDELLGDIKLDDDEDSDDKNDDDDIDLDELLGDIRPEGGKAEKKPRKPAKSKSKKRKG